MSRSIIQPEKIVTEISGVVSKGMQAFGMQAVIVQNEDPALAFRYFVRAGTEVDEGAIVKEDDVPCTIRNPSHRCPSTEQGQFAHSSTRQKAGHGGWLRWQNIRISFCVAPSNRGSEFMAHTGFADCLPTSAAISLSGQSQIVTAQSIWEAKI